ncbi:MAG: ferrous iron transport protein A [Victivallaceae bacterium]|nr:ferrous iron transport protein A [Victivallaceae bacterium]
MTLAEMKEGEIAQIVRVGGSGAIKQRMMDMGIIAGSELKVERYAPLMDPIQIRIKSYSLALRVAEGKLIEVITGING